MESTTEIENSDLATFLKGKSGYLPCQHIEKALKEEIICSKIPIESSQIQPDLPFKKVARSEFSISVVDSICIFTGRVSN
jgi:hypothetical protein